MRPDASVDCAPGIRYTLDVSIFYGRGPGREDGMSDSSRRRVAVVGATGVAGQQFLVALAEHPWFELTVLAASSRSAGRRYRDAIRSESGQLRWSCEEPLPRLFEDRIVEDAAEMDLSQVDLVFSAVESDAARSLEERFAAERPVVSTASAFRYEDDVPIVVPGVNPCPDVGTSMSNLACSYSALGRHEGH